MPNNDEKAKKRREQRHLEVRKGFIKNLTALMNERNYDDKLVITFNYKEASKTVTQKQVNGSIIECSGAPIKRPTL